MELRLGGVWRILAGASEAAAIAFTFWLATAAVTIHSDVLTLAGLWAGAGCCLCWGSAVRLARKRGFVRVPSVPSAPVAIAVLAALMAAAFAPSPDPRALAAAVVLGAPASVAATALVFGRA